MPRWRMPRSLVVLGTILAWSSMTGASDAASPAPGGRYVGDLRGPLRCHGCVEVNLANDGGELIDSSGVNDLFSCDGVVFVLDSNWVGGFDRPWRNTPVRHGR